MSKQTINIGTAANAKNGDSLRAAFNKVNQNFTELYTALGLDSGGLNLGAFEFTGSTITTTDSSSIVIDQATTVTSDLTVGGDLLPSVANGGDLGSAAKPWRSLYVSNNTIYIGGNSLGLDNNGNLAWNGSIVAHADGEFIRLDALTDVNAPNPNAGDTLAWMGSQYVNVPLREDRLHSEGDEVVLVGGANPYVTFPAITGGDQLQISGAEVSALSGNLAFSGQTTITLITNGAGAGGIGSQYFTLGADGSLTIPGTIGSEDEFKIEVNVSDSTKYIWRFGEDGELTFPDSTVQSSAGISASSTDTLTNKTINIQAGQGNVFQIQGNSITSYSGSGAVLALTSMPTFSGMNVNNSSLSIDGGSGSFYANTAFADGAGTIHKAGVYKSANNANNALFTFGANGAGAMSVVMDGSLFIGSALPANNGGLNTDYGGWLVVQAGAKFGGDLNTIGNFILDTPGNYVRFGDGTTQTTAADFGYLDLDKDTIKGTSDYQYTFATDGYFTASTSSESTNYFFVAYNTTNANIAAGWTVVGGTANTTVSSVTYPVAGYPGVIRVNLTAAASSTSGFYPVTVTSPDRLRVEIQPNPGTSDKFAFTTSGLTFPDGSLALTDSILNNGLDADLKGSVFADDSTIMVDAVSNRIYTSELTFSDGTTTVGKTIVVPEDEDFNITLQHDEQTGAGPEPYSFVVSYDRITLPNANGKIFTGSTAGNNEWALDAANKNLFFPSGDRIDYNGSVAGEGLDYGLRLFTYTKPVIVTSGQTQSWTFGTDGNLTLPGDIRSEREINIDINLSDSTLRRWRFGEDGNLNLAGHLQFPNGAEIRDVNGDLRLRAAPGDVAQLQGLDTNGSVDSSVKAFYDNGSFVTINTNIDAGAPEHVWTFDYNGKLTLPGILELSNGAQIFNTAGIDNSITIGATGTPGTTTFNGSGFFIDDTFFHKAIQEKFSSLQDATGVVTHNCANGHIFYHTSPDANWTVNLTNFSLVTNYATAVTIIISQGGTGYYPSALQIGGAAQTINWQGNTTPTPSSNRVDVVTFSIFLTGGGYTVLGQLTGF